MLAELARQIESLELPPDGATLAEGFGLLDRLSAKLSDALGRFDGAQLWDLDAATSATAWLAEHGCMTRSAAASWCSRARRLRQCPHTAAAWATAVLNGGQVSAICHDDSLRPILDLRS